MLEEIKFEYKDDDDESFSYTIMFKESVTLNDGDELFIAYTDCIPVFVAIRRKK